MDIHFIFKPQRTEILTRSGEPRPSDFVTIPFGCDTRTEASQEFMFRGFHEHKKSREMDDACHVGINKLYFPFRSVFGVHGACMARDSPRPYEYE